MQERTPPEVQFVAGTRPEALKIAPVAAALRRRGRLRPVVVASGQHPTMVHQALAMFGMAPDEELPVRRTVGSQPEFFAHVLPALDALWRRRPPAAVVVQGDTSTTFAAALVAFWHRLPVVHLEAGLRSHDLSAPFPEEANRRFVSIASTLHLAPTPTAARHLDNEGIPMARVVVTGNTAVDAVHAMTARPRDFAEPRLSDVEGRALSGQRRVVLVTVHRRESWGVPMDRVLRAVRTLVRAHEDIEVVLPAHPNPAVRAQVENTLRGCERVLVTGPLEYADLVRLLAVSTLVLSDSGGIQEEAPTFSVPVLVLRDVTERLEAVEAGCAILVGTDEERILATAGALLDDPAAAAAMASRGNPFGDGRAAERTEAALAHLLGLTDTRPQPFQAAMRPVPVQRPAGLLQRVPEPQ
ncbi:UDP-N-acetylglucosamine 2-epimerase (non-hydrolyzing) [Saccharothrix sp. AJ9571]|nr:UDP-N-acetylglucosamine 2-epimerase (non-hydrolyzing) [Saccharothrix sp. AJ9571]